jgi:hypothetical protein
VDRAQRLAQQLRDAEDRIVELEAAVEAHRQQAERAVLPIGSSGRLSRKFPNEDQQAPAGSGATSRRPPACGRTSSGRRGALGLRPGRIAGAGFAR